MALKKTLADPLNWLLFILAIAFGYYVIAVPYFTERYLKTPQDMALSEYMDSPSHPRPFMLHALSAPPSSIEIRLTRLRVAHIDQDSILLVGDDVGTSLGGTETMPATASVEEPAEDTDTTPEATEEDDEEEEVNLIFEPESLPPTNEILVPGENLDLLPVSLNQVISLQVHGLHESPLGWIPLELTLSQEQEEFFNKDELDAMEQLQIIANGEASRLPYVETGEMRLAEGVQPPGEPVTLEDLENDTRYIQTVNRLSGDTVDLHGGRIVERRVQDRTPYFVFEDDQGRRARVFYNPRLLTEWYWALDRLQNKDSVARGTLRALTPADLRTLEAEANIQAVLDGFSLLSKDGTIVFNLENPAAFLGL